MPHILAIAAVAGLFLVLLVPLAAAAWKGVSAAPVAAGYTLPLALITTYHSGMFSQAELPDLDIAESEPSSLANSQCAEVLSLLDRAEAILDRSRPPRLVVAQANWSQLPEAAQEAVKDCVQRSWPSDADTVQVEAH